MSGHQQQIFSGFGSPGIKHRTESSNEKGFGAHAGKHVYYFGLDYKFKLAHCSLPT